MSNLLMLLEILVQADKSYGIGVALSRSIKRSIVEIVYLSRFNVTEQQFNVRSI